MTVTRSLGPRSSVPPLGARRKQRVSADTLHRVAAAHHVRGRMHGRRTTAVAVVLTACLHRDLTCPTDPVRAAGADGLLTGQLQILMLLPSPGGVHLVTMVIVSVGVGAVLRLQVGGGFADLDAPSQAWHWFARR